MCYSYRVMHSEQLKHHMVSIGVYQSLSNSALYEHICLENIKKLYKSSGKCDDQQQYKAILEASMVSTTDLFTGNSSISPGPSVTVKNSSEKNRWELPVTHYHEIMAIYPYPFLVVFTQFFSWIIFNNYCISILNGSPG